MYRIHVWKVLLGKNTHKHLNLCTQMFSQYGKVMVVMVNVFHFRRLTFMCECTRKQRVLGRMPFCSSLFFSFFNVCPLLMSSVCVFPGILPPHSDSHPLVSRYRAEQYEDVRGALVTMRFVNKATPLTELHLRMFQLENQMLLRCSELSPVREREKETCMYRSKCNCRLDLHVCMLRYTTHHFKINNLPNPS